MNYSIQWITTDNALHTIVAVNPTAQNLATIAAGLTHLVDVVKLYVQRIESMEIIKTWERSNAKQTH